MILNSSYYKETKFNEDIIKQTLRKVEILNLLLKKIKTFIFFYLDEKEKKIILKEIYYEKAISILYENLNTQKLINDLYKKYLV